MSGSIRTARNREHAKQPAFAASVATEPI